MPLIMKPRFDFFPRHRMSGLLVVALLGAATLRAAPPPPAAPVKAPPTPRVEAASTNVVLEIPRSVFVVSSPTQAVRDPFFPNSSRLGPQPTTRTNVTGVVVVADLVLKAIFGTASRPLATINNATFGVGEEQEVLTPAGRVRVRCVDIQPTDEIVVVEVAGARRELRFPRRK